MPDPMVCSINDGSFYLRSRKNIAIDNRNTVCLVLQFKKSPSLKCHFVSTTVWDYAHVFSIFQGQEIALCRNPPIQHFNTTKDL